MGHVERLFGQYERYVVDRADNEEDAEVNAAVVLWHPDDEILLSIALAAAQNYRMRLHGITLSRGEATTKNFRRHEGFDPALGHRSEEAASGARSLGFASHTQLEAPDGQPHHDLSQYTAAVADILMDRNIDLVLSTTRMSPHDGADHMAAGMVAFMAAERATQGFGRHMGVMIVQPGERGHYAAESYTESLAIAGRIAMANSSQFRVGPAGDRPADWYALTEDWAMHPDDWRELQQQQYPIAGTAWHTYAKCGQLLVPQLLAA